jgi:hypothetical protein
MSYHSLCLDEIKEKVAFRLTNGEYRIKYGIKADVDLFLQSLIHINDKLSQPKSMQKDVNGGLHMSEDLLLKHPILSSLVEFYSREQDNIDQNSMLFLNSFMDNLLQNLSRAKSSYRFNEYVKKFSVVFFILAGRNAYEFVRLNIPGAFPSISAIQSLIEKEESYIIEGEFRFDVVKNHLSLSHTNIAFCSEDCTAIIPKVSFDTSSNSFVGFSLPLVEGIPISNYYQTDSISKLEQWFSDMDKSSLLNLHVVQPIPCIGRTSSPVILSAYGTNSRYRSFDILRRWIWIFEEFLSRDIRIIGSSTDADPKYMRAMKLVLGFFASLPNVMISERSDAFEIFLPNDWHWFFLRRRQLVLCLKDATHVCTKLRNRLLSTTADLTIGDEQISLNFLSEMIATSNKLNHGLVKSDIYPRDKQNFASCDKISSDCVLSELEKFPGSSATCLYLKLIRSTIIAYIDKSTTLNERVYHAWFCVFVCRLWWSWLIVKAERESIQSKKRSSSEKYEPVWRLIQRFFIMKASYESIEINAHQLTYLILLVEEKLLPVESLQIFLFNSQSCETTFRSARSMSGSFSSIVNFSVTQFLRRAQKISIMNKIRSESDMHSATLDALPLHFSSHHKQKSKSTSFSAVPLLSSMTREEIDTIVSSAFYDAYQLLNEFGIHDLLKKRKLDTLRTLSNFVFSGLDSMSRTIDTASMTTASSRSDTDDEYEDDVYDDEINGSVNQEDSVYDSDDEQSIYSRVLWGNSDQNFKNSF